MRIFKTTVGLAVVLLSVLGLLICLTGTAGVWLVHGRVANLSGVAFSSLNDSLEFMNVMLGRVKVAIDKSRERVSLVSKAAERLTAEAADARAEATSLLQSLDEAAQELRAAEDYLESCKAFANGFSRVSDSLLSSDYAAANPESGVVAIVQRTGDLAQSVADALAKVQQVREELRQIREEGKIAAELGRRIVAQLIDLDGKVANISLRLDSLTAKITQARASSVDLGQNVQGWIRLSTAIFTALCVWFGISQLNMTLQGWRLTRGKCAA